MQPFFSGFHLVRRKPSGRHWFAPPTHRTLSTPNAPRPPQDAPKIFKTGPKTLRQDPKTVQKLPKNAGRAQNVPKDPPRKRNWSPHPLGTARLAAFFACWLCFEAASTRPRRCDKRMGFEHLRNQTRVIRWRCMHGIQRKETRRHGPCFTVDGKIIEPIDTGPCFQ